MAVSPFDGANRIRFKGSLDFDCQTLSRFNAAPPKTLFASTVYYTDRDFALTGFTRPPFVMFRAISWIACWLREDEPRNDTNRHEHTNGHETEPINLPSNLG
jgi:hypothetical protein